MKTQLKERYQAQLKRSACLFRIGEEPPTYLLEESWIGRVGWQRSGEEIPLDASDKPMQPVLMLSLIAVPYQPSPLLETTLLSIYLADDFAAQLALGNTHLEGYYCVREYNRTDALVACDHCSTCFESFPLQSKKVENEYPHWNQGGIPEQLKVELEDLASLDLLDYYDDVFENNYAVHKLGGYPSFCQSGIDFSKQGYQFVLQIASDEQAGLQIFDKGNFYFYRHSTKKDWKLWCDFY